MASLRSENARVLVIDDNEALRAIVKRALERVQVAVTTSTNASEALDLLATQAIEVVLTDITMPGMDGWQFCARAHAQYPHLILGIMSGWELTDQSRLVAHGVSFVISKPFNIRELQTQVLDLLRQKEQST